MLFRSVAGVVGQQRIERVEDFGFDDVLAIQRVEPLAAVVGAEHQVVAPGGLANQRDLAQVGARAAVGATADAQVDRGVGNRSEEHTSELQSLMRNSYAVLR